MLGRGLLSLLRETYSACKSAFEGAACVASYRVHDKTLTIHLHLETADVSPDIRKEMIAWAFTILVATLILRGCRSRDRY